MFASLVGWAVDQLAGSTKTVGEYIASTVRPGEVASGRYPKRGPAELIARNQQTVYFCATTTAATCASVKMRLYTRADAADAEAMGGKRTRRVTGKRAAYLRSERVGVKAAGYADSGDFIEVLEHPLLDHLRRPNPWTTGWAYSYLGHLFRLLAGNDYQYFTDGEGGGFASFHLFPQHTSIQPSETGFVDGYWYARDTTAERFFEADEVDHYPFLPSAMDPYYGTGPLHACFREADILSYATDSELFRWINGGQPDWVVVAPPGTGPDQIEAIRTGIAQRVVGVKNKGKFLVTSGGVEVKPGAFKPMELEYEKGMNRADLVIARCFGMTEAQLLVNSANVASAREAARWWRETSILPIVSRDAESQSEMLLPRFGLEPGVYWLAPDDPVPQDEAADMTRAVSGYGGGLLTLNEARAELGYPPAGDGGDDFKAPPPSPFGSLGGGGVGGPGGEDGGGEEEHGAEDDQEDTTEASDGADGTKADHRSRRRGRERSACRCDGCEHERSKRHRTSRGRLTTKDDRADPVEAIMRALGRDLEAWYAEAAKGGIRPDGRVDLSPFNAQLDKILAAHLPDILRLGMLTGMSEVGMEPSLADLSADATRFLSSYTPRLAREISDSETAALKMALESAVGQGVARVDAIALVQSSGVTQSAWKADRIVRTETGIITGRGTMEGWKLGGVTQKEWQLSAGACATCQAFAEQYGSKPIDINAVFAAAGTEIGGITLWRDVVSGSEVHPNCACFILPVMGDEGKAARARAMIFKRHGVKP